jgi:hypothetical protein
MAAYHKPPAERDQELLSAYLDGELTEREQQKLQARLVRDEHLRAALDDLREVVKLVHSLPQVKAPRSFTLDPAVYGHQPPQPWWRRLLNLGTILQLGGALGTAAAAVLLVLAFTLGTGEEQATPRDQTAVGYAPAWQAEKATTAARLDAAGDSDDVTTRPSAEVGALEGDAADADIVGDGAATGGVGMATSPPTVAAQAQLTAAAQATVEEQAATAPAALPSPASDGFFGQDDAGLADDATGDMPAAAAPPVENAAEYSPTPTPRARDMVDGMAPAQAQDAADAAPGLAAMPTATAAAFAVGTPAPSPTLAPTATAPVTPSATVTPLPTATLTATPLPTATPSTTAAPSPSPAEREQPAEPVPADDETVNGWLLGAGVLLLVFSLGAFIVGRQRS